MKIEMDDKTAVAVMVVAACAVIGLTVWLIYRYKVSFVEQGYVHMPMIDSYWTKTNNLVGGK